MAPYLPLPPPAQGSACMQTYPQSPFTAPAPEEFKISAVALPDLQIFTAELILKTCTTPGLSLSLLLSLLSENFHLKKKEKLSQS